jgi:predicted site-specific integrase-resolvase
MKRDALTTAIESGAGGVFEEILTPAEIAERLKVSTNTARRLFQDREGVIKIGEANPRGKRGYQTLRVPRIIFDQVMRELSR